MPACFVFLEYTRSGVHEVLVFTDGVAALHSKPKMAYRTFVTLATTFLTKHFGAIRLLEILLEKHIPVASHLVNAKQQE